MALDFSKFLLPAPSTEWLSKIPEYNAMGAKVAATQAAATKKTGKVDKISDFAKMGENLNIPVPVEVANIKNAAINTTVKEMQDALASGKTYDEVMDMGYKKFTDLKSFGENSQSLNAVDKAVEAFATKNPGVDVNVMKNYARQKFLLNDDGTPKQFGEIKADPVVLTQEVLENSNGYTGAGFDEHIGKAGTISGRNKVKITDQFGKSHIEDRMTNMPAGLFELQTNAKGDEEYVPVHTKEQVPSPELANIMHEAIGDNQGANQELRAVTDDVVAGFADKPAMIGYLNQETKNLEKKIDAYNTANPSAPITLTANDKELFKKALAYRKFDVSSKGKFTLSDVEEDKAASLGGGGKLTAAEKKAQKSQGYLHQSLDDEPIVTKIGGKFIDAKKYFNDVKIDGKDASTFQKISYNIDDNSFQVTDSNGKTERLPFYKFKSVLTTSNQAIDLDFVEGFSNYKNKAGANRAYNITPGIKIATGQAPSKGNATTKPISIKVGQTKGSNKPLY